MTVNIKFQYRWDEAAMQTETLLPSGAHAALLTYEADPWPH